MSNDPETPSRSTDSSEPPFAAHYAPAGAASSPRTSLAYFTAATPAYTSARPAATTLVTLIAMMIALEVLAVWPAIEELEIARRGSSEWSVAGGFLRMIVPLPFILYAVCWLMWVFHTYRNLPALGAARLQFSPAWAVGCYFIPILHLFWPYQVMRETWLASDPSPNGGKRATRLIDWWWGLTLVGLAHSAVGATITFVYDSPPAMMHVFAWTEFGRIAVAIATYVLEIVLVRKLTRRQEQRAGTIAAAHNPAPSPVPVV